MQIVILDGNALNPGDLSWEPLKQFGTLTVYPRTPQNQVIERIGNSEVVLLNKVNITEEILTACPALKYIGVQATGYNVIDIDACKRHGVTVTNVPAYSTAAVAQLTFAFISEIASRAKEHSDTVLQGDWVKAKDFCYWKTPLTELEGKTLGIFGYGSIGRRVHQIAQAYGLKTITCTRTQKPDVPNPVDFDTLLSKSDIITLHAPLTAQTKGIINSESIAKMKKTAWLINTARGAFVNEADVAKALTDGDLAYYATDVLVEEPMRADCPLLTAPKDKIMITPHIAWAAVETRTRLLEVVISNLQAWIQGKSQNVVS